MSRPTGREQAEAFVAWALELDADELAEYRAYLEAFAGDETRFGGFATVALKVVGAAELKLAAAEMIAAACLPDENFELFRENLGAIEACRASLNNGLRSQTNAEMLDMYAAALECTEAALTTQEGDER